VRKEKKAKNPLSVSALFSFKGRFTFGMTADFKVHVTSKNSYYRIAIVVCYNNGIESGLVSLKDRLLFVSKRVNRKVKRRLRIESVTMFSVMKNHF